MGAQTGAPECPRGSKGTPKAPIWGSFSFFFLTVCSQIPDGVKKAAQAPSRAQNLAKMSHPGSKNPSKRSLQCSKLAKQTELPKRKTTKQNIPPLSYPSAKNCKDQCISTELPKGKETTRCGGVALRSQYIYIYIYIQSTHV